MPDPITAISGGSALLGASSANKAAKSQEAAANRQMDIQQETYNDQKALFQPYREAGGNYLAVQQYLDGIGSKPTIGGDAPQISTVNIPGSTPGEQGTRSSASDLNPLLQPQSAGRTEYQVGGQTFQSMEDAKAWASANKTGGQEYQGFQATPGYQWAVDQGVGAIDAGAAAKGGLYSGKTMQDLQTYGQGMANQEFNNYYNRIAGGANQGQAAAGQTALAGQNYATGTGNALANLGNAQAAGAIGVGNALQGGINNGIGLYQYQNQLNAGAGAGQGAGGGAARWSGLY